MVALLRAVSRERAAPALSQSGFLEFGHAAVASSVNVDGNPTSARKRCTIFSSRL
jgi:hypothetical protein